MVQYNNMTSPGGIIYSWISDHFLISLAYKAEMHDTTDSLSLDLYCDPNQNYNTFHDHHTKLKRETFAIQICKI